MIVNIYNFSTMEKLASTEIKETTKNESGFSLLRRLSVMQKDADVLGVGKIGVAEFGIKQLFTRGFCISSFEASNVMHTGENSFVLDMVNSHKVEKPANLVIDGEDMGFPVAIEMYTGGWVLFTGTQGYNIFGGKFGSYLTSIGSKNIHCDAKGGCKVFTSLKAIISYIEKHKDTFEFCVSTHGYHWSIEPTCEKFEAGFVETLSPKQLDKYHDAKKEIETLLNDINGIEMSDDEDVATLPNEANEETINAEVLYRMKRFNLFAPVIDGYKKSKKLFQSEAGGIIYELDEQAKVAVENVEGDGYTPYHVIVNNTQFGKTYTVLYVSNTVEDWNGERALNSYGGDACAYVYNADAPECSEYGYVGLQSANGGIVRTA